MYNFEELDEVTRKWMLKEFLDEENSGNPYRSKRLSPLGLEVFPKEIEEAIRGGNEESLARALSNPSYWKQSESSRRGIKGYSKSVDPIKSARALAYTEFNTWYVRGFARRLIEEGVEYCQVYRAAAALAPRRECLQHEGKTYKVEEIYKGHRARYWPEPGNLSALSIPLGTYCHHSIRRVR